MRRSSRTLTIALFLTAATLAPPLVPPRAASAQPASGEALKVHELVVAEGVEEREPIGKSDTFSVGAEAIFAWLSVRNPGPEKTVEIVWSKDGKPQHTYQAEIGRSTRWRTWASLTLTPSHEGDWTVEVLGPGGDSLAQTSFTVTD